MTVQVRLFDSLDVNEMPDSEAVAHECTDEATAGSGCALSMQSDGLHITVSEPGSAEAVVVMAAWYVPAESRIDTPGDPDVDTAAWGIRLDG